MKELEIQRALAKDKENRQIAIRKLIVLKAAWDAALEALQDCGEDVSADYPFDQAMEDLDVKNWVTTTAKMLEEKNKQ